MLWISWSHYSGGTRKTDLVRFQWRRLLTTGPPVRQHSRSCRSSASRKTCRPSLTPRDLPCLSHQWKRPGSLRASQSQNGLNRTHGKAGSFPLTKARATAMGWKDRYVMEGCATVGDRLWRYTGNAPAKRWRATTSPKTRAGLARVSGSQRAWRLSRTA